MATTASPADEAGARPAGEDLRGLLERFDAARRLFRIRAEVDPVFELAAVCRKMQRDPALSDKVVLFERVKGSPLPVVANLCDSREKLAVALGTTARQAVDQICRAIDQPTPPMLVEAAPCQEVVVQPPDLSLLPVPTLSELDGGPYITVGLHLSRNPATGIRNASIQRNQVHGRDLLGIYMAPTHLLQHFIQAQRHGQSLPVAIAIGVHPALLVASQLRLPFDTDELAVAGTLLGHPVRLARCRTIDLEAPADAEIIIEGEILPDERRLEGPFGEFARLYGPARELPVIRVAAITHRRGAIYHSALCASSPETVTLGAVGREPSLLRALRASVPTVTAVRMTLGGGANFEAIVALQKNFEGEPQKVGFAAFAAQDLIKHVYVVDDDIDIFDDEDVRYAITTRMDPARDIHVIENVKGNPLDPMSIEYAPGRAVVNKMIVDATKPLDATDRYRVADVPAEVLERVERNWPDYIGGGGEAR